MSDSGTPSSTSGPQDPPDDDPKTSIRPAGSPTAPQYGNPGYQPPPPGSYGQPTPPPAYSGDQQYGGAQYGGQYGGQPYGQPSSGQPYPGQQGYGQPYPPQGQQGYDQGYGYAQQQGYGYPQQGYGSPAAGGYASWGQRVVATLWDVVYVWPALIAFAVAVVFFAIGGATSDGGSGGAVFFLIGALAYLAAIVLAIYRYVRNYMVDQGRTGYTYGKRKVGIRLVSEQTGQAPGVGSCIGRYFLHGIINYAFFIDYLWPLWDAKKQTLTDKVLTTVEIQQPAA